jgi:integrase
VSRTAGVGKVYTKGKNKGWGFYFRHGERTYRGFNKKWDKDKAMEEKRKLEAKLGAGYDDRRAKEVTFDDLAKLIREDYAVNRNRSTRSMEGRMAHLRDFFKGDGLAPSIEPRWPAYLKKRVGEAAPATIQYELSVLRRMFKLAYLRSPRMVERPLYIPTVKVNNARQGFFEADEREAVLANLPEDVGAFVEFLALTSWRSGEAKWLTWKRIDYKGGTVTLDAGTTKNGEGRTLYFDGHPRLAALLRNQRERAMAAGALKPDMPVFFRVLNGEIRPVNNFKKTWSNACKAAGCEGKIPHDFRRTCVRDMERAGIPRSISMAISGHKTEAIFRRYAIVSPRDQAQAMAQLAKSQEMTNEVADSAQDASR